MIEKATNKVTRRPASRRGIQASNSGARRECR
jgi:hypothetical protein